MCGNSGRSACLTATMLILPRRWVWVSMIERKIWSSSAVSLSMVFVRITCCHFAA
ncbi:putative gTP cyclohydrolase 1 3 [Burkholderia pseudomallei]|nr:putative gTP cyclohydrolase 1 3 [Burkholderia pseudomallei]